MNKPHEAGHLAAGGDLNLTADEATRQSLIVAGRKRAALKKLPKINLAWTPVTTTINKDASDGEINHDQ